MKYSGVGGQAVIEGVMMKNGDKVAVAVRKEDKQIVVDKKVTKSIRDKYKVFKAPIIRGVVIFIESLIVGLQSLNFSASQFDEESNENTSEKKEGIIMGILTFLSVVLAIGIFVVLPFFVSELLENVIPSMMLRGLIEGIIRVALFVGYVFLIRLMNDIQRVFMYHGAEHKTINCLENGLPLSIENVKKQSTFHRRCGTSFLLVVMVVSILFFMFISVPNVIIRMLLRIVLVPVIAGLSYEFIKFSGNHDNKVVNAISKPGFLLQKLTTSEPTEDMLEVAIESVNAVFDVDKFLSEYEDKQ